MNEVVNTETIINNLVGLSPKFVEIIQDQTNTEIVFLSIFTLILTMIIVGLIGGIVHSWESFKQQDCVEAAWVLIIAVVIIGGGLLINNIYNLFTVINNPVYYGLKEILHR